MSSIRIFEPALCCNTGVCGPDVDQALVTFSADVAALKAAGADISRANLAGDPAVFAANPTVVRFLHTAGSEGLPLTVVDDVTVLTGRYPDRAELERYAAAAPAGPEMRVTLRTELPLAGGCCGGSASSGCC